MLIRAISRSKSPFIASAIKDLIKTIPTQTQSSVPENSPRATIVEPGWRKPFFGLFSRQFHDGRPRGPLWKGKKLIGKEALFVILGLKRFKDDEEKLDIFVKNHVLRLLKLDMIAVLTELERQEEVALALKRCKGKQKLCGSSTMSLDVADSCGIWRCSIYAVKCDQIFEVIQKQDWYKPDVYLYKDLIVALSRCEMMDEVVQLWEYMKKEDLFPDSRTYTEVIRGYLKYSSPSDAMNIYEDMLKSPDPPEELPFRVLLKGLLPHPLLRNKVKKDFEEIFPESHVYDPPEEIFGMR